jgi:hypothetical protein
MSTPRIYALLVGIDKYLPPVPALDGCVNDMRAMHGFLERRAQQTGAILDAVILENQEATRLNIVSKFETHLTQAGPDDIAFFYYSGHGSQEPAHELFWEVEEDKKNETLVCYDSRLVDGMDLADKEISTLIGLVAEKNPHILVVMDCCNSGGGTREVNEQVTKARQVDATPQERSIDSYILPRSLNTDRSALSSAGISQLLIPDARHVAFSAAQSFLLAKETYLGGSPRGVFTYSMLEVLENAVGPLSYGDLIRRVRGLVTQRTFEQTPQLFSKEPDDLDLVFLNGAATRKSSYFSLTFDRQMGWAVDAGRLQGIPDAGAEGATEFGIFAEDASDEEMSRKDRMLGTVLAQTVEMSRTLVQPQGEPFLHDINAAYRARITRSPMTALKVFFRGDEHGVNLAKIALGQDSDASVFLQLVDRQQDAAYHLVAGSREFPGQYLIIRKTDKDSQPLVEQVQGFTSASAEKVIDHLVHIARWEQVAARINPQSLIPESSLAIELYHPTENRLLAADPKNGFFFPYKKAAGRAGLPGFRVKVVNRSSQRLYFALLYLSSQFGVTPDVLPQGGLWLDPGAEAWAVGGRAIQGEVRDPIYQLGRREIQERFKLFASTREFDARTMRQEDLNLPRTRSASLDDAQKSRSLMLPLDVSASGDDWNSSELSLTLRRED